jgi:hypothetical protein
MPTNIETFDSAVAAILAHLYGTFPRLETLNAFELAGSSDAETCAIYAGTVVFLEREGFLRYFVRSGGNGQFFSAALTAKGLELLRATPESLRSKAPIGEQLRDAVKGGAKELAKELGKLVLRAATSPETWRALTHPSNP